MTDEQLTELFLNYWNDSFPNSRPIQHAINTHVGFGRYLVNFLELQGKTDDA